jgi:hypothetical protein
MSEPYRCLSYGGGVQSTAMLLASCHGELVMQLRETFLTWVGTVGQLGDARVFVIVHDVEVARVIAHELHARLIQINQEHIARLV